MILWFVKWIKKCFTHWSNEIWFWLMIDEFSAYGGIINDYDFMIKDDNDKIFM